MKKMKKQIFLSDVCEFCEIIDLRLDLSTGCMKDRKLSMLQVSSLCRTNMSQKKSECNLTTD